MLLNYEEILLANLLKNFTEKNFRTGSYDLTINHIIDLDGCEKKEINLAPQGMVTVVFKEEVEMPSNILSYAHVKTSLARRGIMAISIGIIDPTYKGLISTVIINYGNKPYTLKVGDSALRLTFHKIAIPQKNKVVNSASSGTYYVQERELETQKFLGDSFLNLKDVEKRIEKNVTEWVWKRIGVISTIVSAIAFIAALFFNVLNYNEKSNDNYLKSLNTQAQNTQESYKQLELKLQLQQQLIDSLRRKR
ncbi:MAG: hypothetical protein QM541_04795 [Flavobacterium sp.]|nr:hypothetical protein [Flavobacterium sp.]